MVTLRCTRKLLARLRASPEPEDVAPTTKLGDWYANLLYAPGGQAVLFVSERSLLPIVVPAKEARTLVDRFRALLREVLSQLGVPRAAIDRELAEMEGVRFGKTVSRQILGSMTDFAYLFHAGRGTGGSMVDVSLDLADAPCGPLGMRRPRDVAVELFTS